jgi:membrane protein
MVGALMLREIGIIELGERSIRKFFEHRMKTYAAALAYRGLFGLFPFVLILVVLAGLLGFADFFHQLVNQTGSEPTQQVPQQLEPAVERGREQLQPLERMIEQAQKQAGGELLLFGVAIALWSTSALARTLTEAFNAAYEIAETRPGWKRFALRWAFGPILALVGLDEVFISLWGWLRYPVALSLLAVVVSLVYRFGPDARQRFRSVSPGAALAVVSWAVSSVGFSFYLANFADYGVTYGSLGAAVGLLFYLYLTASVVLFGAEVNAVIYHALPDGMMETEVPNPDHKSSNGPDKRIRDA